MVLRPKKNCEFPLTRPSLFWGADPKLFFGRQDPFFSGQYISILWWLFRVTKTLYWSTVEASVLGFFVYNFQALTKQWWLPELGEMLAYLAVEIEKCDHQEHSRRSLALLKYSRTFMGVPRYPKQRTFEHQLWGGGFEVDDTLTVSDLLTVTKTSVNKTLKIYLLEPHLRKTLLILTLEKG